MKRRLIITVLAIVFVISGALANETSVKVKADEQTYCSDIFWDADFSSIGLDEMHVESMATTSKFLYAGTTDGIYRLDLSVEMHNNEFVWEFLGFEGELVNSIYIDPAFPKIIHVGLYVNGPINSYGEPHSLYKSNNGGETWKPIDEGIERVEPTGFGTEDIYIPNTRLTICCITGEPGDPQILYATSFACIFKSTNGGYSWNLIWGDPCLNGNGIHTLIIDPLNPECLWAGGEGSIYFAIIIKSTDGGYNWDFVTPWMGGDNACYTLAVHPLDSNTVYAGMEGKLAKTTDGGETWGFVLSPPEHPYIRGLVINPLEPNRIYAGGANNSPSAPLRIWGSNNNGQSWSCCSDDQAEMVRTIVLDSDDPDVLYIGTKGTGVYMCHSDTWGTIDYSTL